MSTLPSWVPLDLDDVAFITSQVDEVISMWKASIIKDSGQGISPFVVALKQSIDERIDALEQFYNDNELDERALMFEKQRLKLRRALREDPFFVPPTPKSKSSERASQLVLPPPLTQVPDDVSAGGREDSNPVDIVQSVERIGEVGKAEKGREVENAQPKRKKKVVPIYDWEKPDYQKSRDNKKDQKKSGDAGNRGDQLQFEVKLTRAEFEDLMSRRQNGGNDGSGRMFLKKGDGKLSYTNTQRLSGKLKKIEEEHFITSRTPYVDPVGSTRDVNRERWISSEGFVAAVGKTYNSMVEKGKGKLPAYISGDIPYTSGNPSVVLQQLRNSPDKKTAFNPYGRGTRGNEVDKLMDIGYGV